MLEALSFVVVSYGTETEDFVGSVFQAVEEEVLVNPGSLALRQLTF